MARLTGEDVNRAVVRAIEELLARERGRAAPSRGSAGELLGIGEVRARLPELNERDGDAVLYDAEGLPKARERA